MFHHHNLLYPLTGLKWKERPHTLHREYSPNVKAWKDLEGVLTEGQGKERAASRPFYVLYFRFLSQFCQYHYLHSFQSFLRHEASLRGSEVTLNAPFKKTKRKSLNTLETNKQLFVCLSFI